MLKIWQWLFITIYLSSKPSTGFARCWACFSTRNKSDDRVKKKDPSDFAGQICLYKFNHSKIDAIPINGISKAKCSCIFLFWETVNLHSDCRQKLAPAVLFYYRLLLLYSCCSYKSNVICCFFLPTLQCNLSLNDSTFITILSWWETL